MRGDRKPVRPALSVVVPLHRTRAALAQLHARLARVLAASHTPYEVILVDDACPDGSGEAARALAARDAHVRVVVLPRNVGQHRAVTSGLAVAEGEWIVVMDGDLQDEPEAIPTLIAARAPGIDAVFAGRRGRYESGGRLATSRVFKWCMARLAGVPRDAGLFVLLSRRVATAVVAGMRPGASVVALIGLNAARAVSVPVERMTRPAGRSAYSAWGRARAGASALAWVLWWKCVGGIPAGPPHRGVMQP